MDINHALQNQEIFDPVVLKFNIGDNSFGYDSNFNHPITTEFFF